MPVFAISIVKSTSYQGGVREFGNTYHYKTDTLELFDDAGIAAKLAAEEKLVTTIDAAFVRWVSWGPTDGGTFANVMREDGTLSGNGALAAGAGLYKEACSLVTFPLSRSPVTNRKRWLRKFLRMGLGSGTVSVGTMNGSAPLTAAAITALTAFGNAVKEVATVLGTYQLCSEGGAEPVSAVEVRPYLYTRDIGQ